jgi:hypothetical protein
VGEVKKLFMVQLPENTYFWVSFRVNCACGVCLCLWGWGWGEVPVHGAAA